MKVYLAKRISFTPLSPNPLNHLHKSPEVVMLQGELER